MCSNNQRGKAERRDESEDVAEEEPPSSPPWLLQPVKGLGMLERVGDDPPLEKVNLAIRLRPLFNGGLQGRA